MYKLIEIEGRWIQVFYKTIEINGESVITEGDIKILNQFNYADIEKQIQQNESTAARNYPSNYATKNNTK